MGTKLYSHSYSKLFFYTLLTLASPILSPSGFAQQSNSVCPVPVLSRLQTHRVASGETLESIARQYNLQPATLININSLGGNSVPVGRELQIPPFNGTRVRVPSGSTWKDLGAAYGVPADVLFELNGCQDPSGSVFIPGLHGQSRQNATNPRVDNYQGLASYPLPQRAPVGLSYGWHTNSTTQENTFHSGVDFLVSSGTSVLAADAGTVMFVGVQGDYGRLVVINHSGGRQTRYAHLESTQVQPGQTVQAGEILGTVGTTGKPDLEASHLHFEVRQNLTVGWVAQDPEIHLTRN